jgi:hypothetical protein
MNWWNRLRRREQIQITATDPITLITIVTLLMVVVSVACSLPARRAARLDRLAVLRCGECNHAVVESARVLRTMK